MYKDTFKMNNGDMDMKDGKIKMESAQDELRQSLQNRFSINKGEWFLDLELGFDYSAVVGKNVPDSRIELAVRECALQDERVSQVIDIKIERDVYTRRFSVDFLVLPKEGESFRQEVVFNG